MVSSRGFSMQTPLTFEAELDYVETNNKNEVKLSGMNEESKARAMQLFRAFCLGVFEDVHFGFFKALWIGMESSCGDS